MIMPKIGDLYIYENRKKLKVTGFHGKYVILQTLDQLDIWTVSPKELGEDDFKPLLNYAIVKVLREI